MERSDWNNLGIGLVLVGIATVLAIWVSTSAAALAILVGFLIMARVNHWEIPKIGWGRKVERPEINVGQEWGFLVYGFNTLLNKGLIALWSKTPEGLDSWEISNGQQVEQEAMRSLCNRAGAVLLHSKKVNVDPAIRNKADSVDRWLSFIRQ